MKSTESMEQRLNYVDMHEYFLQRISNAMEKGNYIEASWLIYSCLENRYFRTLQKYRDKCKYCRSKSKCNHKMSNDLALATKIKCVKRLYENHVLCIQNAFREDIFIETLAWIDERNKLMHELLSLEYYQETDKRFEKSANDGVKLLNETYESCTSFRELYFADDYSFVFPIAAMEACSCKPREDK